MQPLHESDAEHSHNQPQSLLISYLHNIGQGECRSACFDAADVPHQMRQNSCHQEIRSRGVMYRVCDLNMIYRAALLLLDPFLNVSAMLCVLCVSIVRLVCRLQRKRSGRWRTSSTSVTT